MEKKIYTFLLISITISFITLYTKYKSHLQKEKKVKKNFQIPTSDPAYQIYDYYLFSVQWGSSMCLNYGSSCEEFLKKIPKHHISIHGLWPSLLSGKRLPVCNSGTEIDIIEDDTEIFSKMNKFWVSLSGKGNKVFWDHEYNKHGYCYNQRFNFDVNDYKKYFEKTMEIFEENNLGKLIINALNVDQSFIGEKSYSFKELYNKIKEILKIDNFAFSCIKVKRNSKIKKQYLSEIRIPIGLDFKLYKGKVQNGGSCSSKTDINLIF
jgi:ribonuclease I